MVKPQYFNFSALRRNIEADEGEEVQGRPETPAGRQQGAPQGKSVRVGGRSQERRRRLRDKIWAEHPQQEGPSHGAHRHPAGHAPQGVLLAHRELYGGRPLQ